MNSNKEPCAIEDIQIKKLDRSLQNVAQGTLIVIISTGIALVLGFISRIFLARVFTQYDYGVYSLSIVIFSILESISLLGLGSGTTRYIAYHREKNDPLKVKQIILSSIQISLFTSIIISISLFLLSDLLSQIFNDSALAYPLKIVAIAIPFTVMTDIFVAISRGFNIVKEKVYFQDILKNAIITLSLFMVVLLKLSFEYAFYTFTFSSFLTFIIYLIYLKDKSHIAIRNEGKIISSNDLRKEILFFSLPILFIVIFQMILSWTDTIMLGVYTTLNDVGLYNAAVPLASFIGIPLSAMLLIYMPTASAQYARNLFKDLASNYAILTKWVFTTTLPLFLIFFIFPENVLNFFFGINYVPAGQALRILSFGYIISNLLGPNGTTLIAIGETRFLMYVSVFAAIINILLNMVLIPPLGIVGASLATAIALSIHCIIRHNKVRSKLKINPITKNLIKTTLITTILTVLISFFLIKYVQITFWMFPLLFISFYLIHFFVILFSKSIEPEEVTLFLEIEKKIGINLSPIKKILKKFL
jgi:O-antigen/teichoic acid export membrane protein